MNIPRLNDSTLATFILVLILAKALGVFDLNIHLQYTKISPIWNRIFWLTIFATCIFLFFRLMHRNYWRITKQSFIKLIPIILIILYIFMSIAWSNYPEISLRRAVLQLTVVFPIVFLVRAYIEIEVVFKTLYRLFSIVLILSFLTFIVGTPFDTFAEGFKGIYSSKNVAGSVAAIAMLTGLYIYFASKLTHIEKKGVVIYMIGWSLILAISLSKTSIALAVLSPVLALLIINISTNNYLNFYFKTILIVGMLLIFSLILIGIDVYNAAINWGLELGFTGRDLIWSLMFQDFEKYWVLGHGYGAFWDLGANIQSLHTDSKLKFLSFIVQGHNGYLDLLLTTGTIGVLLYIVWLKQIFKLIYSSTLYSYRHQFALMTFLTFVLLHNMTESSLFRGDHFVWVIHLLIFGLLLKPNKLYNSN